MKTQGPVTPSMAELSELIREEIDLLDNLLEVLMEQRRAVAESNRERMDQTVQQVADVLDLLTVTRSRREYLVVEIVGEAVPLSQIELRVGVELPEPIRSDRDVLRHRASHVARETAINRRILERVLAAGDRFLTTVIQAAETRVPTYNDAGSRKTGSVLVNRTA